MTGAIFCPKFSISEILFKFASIVLSFFVAVIILPIGLLIFIPIHIHRLIVSKLTSYFLQSTFGKILTTRSTIFSCDKMYESPECLNLVSMTMEGNIPLEIIRQKFSNRILPQILPNGDLRYLELKQYPVPWCGFKFWKTDENFDINNHISLYDKLFPVKDSDLWKIRQEFLRKPFKQKQSPWELLIVHDYQASNTTFLGDSFSSCYSLMYLRIHHSVADGYSILKLLVEGLGSHPIPKNGFVKVSFAKQSVLQTVIYRTLFPFRSLYEFAESALRIRKTAWHVPLNRRTFPVHAVTNYISIGVVKKCKNHHGVSFTSVVLSAATGAIREIMLRKGMKTPDKIVTVCPFPMPGHPDKLRNHMSQGFIELPLGSEYSPEVRLQMLHQAYENLKSSTTPTVNNLLAIVIGGSFTSLVKILTKAVVPSVLITNFPGAFDYISVDGYRCVDCFFACGLLNMPGLGFYILSYGGAVRVVVVSDSSLLSPEEIKEFANLFEMEIDVLAKSATV